MKTGRQLAEECAEFLMRYGDQPTYFSIWKSPRFEVENGKSPNSNDDHAGAKNWIVRALLAGYGVGAQHNHPETNLIFKLSDWKVERDHMLKVYTSKDWPPIAT